MASQVCAAVDERTSLGLALSGVKDILIWGESGGGAALSDWFTSKLKGDYGVMVLSPACARVLSKELLEKRASGAMLPIIVVLPGEEEDARTREMLRRALGMDPNAKFKGGKAK